MENSPLVTPTARDASPFEGDVPFSESANIHDLKKVQSIPAGEEPSQCKRLKSDNYIMPGELAFKRQV